ncbi:membrane protein insertion efficiency factor YidD [Megalodesulfovibrio paquesii]
MKNTSSPRLGPLAGLVIWCIKGYQTVLSPCLPRSCRFWPTCSEYAIGAVRAHGLVAGMLLGAWRILKCNPWNSGGVDPVPERLPAWMRRLARQHVEQAERPMPCEASGTPGFSGASQPRHRQGDG